MQPSISNSSWSNDQYYHEINKNQTFKIIKQLGYNRDGGGFYIECIFGRFYNSGRIYILL